MFVSASFLLPINGPEGATNKYNSVFDHQDQVYRVAARKRSSPGSFPILQYQAARVEYAESPERSEDKDMEDSLIDSEISTFSVSSPGGELDSLNDDKDYSPGSQDCIRFVFSKGLDWSDDDANLSLTESDTPRSPQNCIRFAIREDSEWLNALDVDSPKCKKAHRTSLDWLDLDISEPDFRIASEWVKDNIVPPQCVEFDSYEIDISVAEDGSKTGVKDAEECHQHHPYQGISTRETLRWEDIDLDAVFGGSATDLEGEYEDSALYSGCGGKKTITEGEPGALKDGYEDSALSFGVENLTITEGESGITTITPAVLRQYVPADLDEEVNDFYNSFPLEARQAPNDPTTRLLSKSNVEWAYMTLALRQLKEMNLYKRKELEEADRSCDWFWENGRRPLDVQFDKQTPLVSEEEEPLYHHINFLGYPTYIKSSTLPAVSFWVTFKSTEKPSPLDPYSREAVILSQACRLIDPFEYHWTKEHDYVETESEIKDVCSQIKKVYENSGTWVEDIYDESEHVPKNDNSVDCHDDIYRADNFPCNTLKVPHFVSREDGGDLIINGGDPDLRRRHYRNIHRKFNYQPTKLCIVKFADNEEPEKRKTSSVQMPEGTVLVVDGSEEPDSTSEKAGDVRLLENNDIEPGQKKMSSSLQGTVLVVDGSEDPDSISEQAGEVRLAENHDLESESSGELSSGSSRSNLGEELRQVLLLAAAFSQSKPSAGEPEEKDSIQTSSLSRGSSTHLSASTGPTSLSEEVSKIEKENFARCLALVSGRGEGEVIQSFLDDLPCAKYDYLPDKCYDESNKPVVEESLIEDANFARLRGLEVVLKQEFDFTKQGICSSTVSPRLNYTAGNKQLSVEIPYSDVSQIPLREDRNDKLYGPVAIAVGRKAREFTDWARSYMG